MTMRNYLQIGAHEERRPWSHALLWLLVLTPFFFVTYGFANWAAAQRAFVPSIVFGWERHIPFLAWTIIPYCSTDFLYAASLFVCRTKLELATHVKRLATAQLISIAVFLALPLRFTFLRPHPAGLLRSPLGSMFDALTSLDRPFNQAPSLHLSLTTILWALYSRHLGGGWLWLMRAWMILVGLSTLFTYQHHFIDLPTGIWVGLLCLVLFSDNLRVARFGPVRDARPIKLGAVYLAGFAVLVYVSAAVGGPAWCLLWPAGALLIVALIYFSGRPELFGKTRGKMPTTVVTLLAPYFAAAWLNSRLWTRNRPAASEINNGVWLGGLSGAAKRNRNQFASIVDLTAELPMNASGKVYRAVPMLDLVVPTLRQLDDAVNAIEELKGERPTLVCCALGYSRSAIAIAAWVTASGAAESYQESIARIKARRPGIVLGPKHEERLQEWSRTRDSHAKTVNA